MKKILAFFLVVVVLLGSTQLTIYADNESQGQEITTSVTNGESTKNENDSSMITNEKTVNNESTSPEKTADVKNSPFLFVIFVHLMGLTRIANQCYVIYFYCAVSILCAQKKCTHKNSVHIHE